MYPTYILLGLAICAVWLPSVRVGHIALPPSALLFVASIAAGLIAGFLTWASLPALVVLAALVEYEVGRTRASVAVEGLKFTWRCLAAIAAGIVALGLALHVVPGFRNPILFAGVVISEGAPPFTQYLNFDKGAAGLLLLLGYCHRWRSVDDIRRTAIATLLAIACSCILIFGVALAAGYVKPDPKLPGFAAAFLATNLLFTVVAEEAFFRGLVQSRLRRLLPPSLISAVITVVVSAGLFGAAHAAGGPMAMALACLAGLSYAIVFQVTRRIEPAILTHFAVNGVHFLFFTYPHLTNAR